MFAFLEDEIKINYFVKIKKASLQIKVFLNYYKKYYMCINFGLFLNTVKMSLLLK